MSERLIYAEDAIEALTEVESHYEFEDGHDRLLRWAKNKITALPSAQPEHEVRFSDADHVWIDGKQYISLKRFGEAVKDAQPEKRTEERTETHARDLISRQGTIDLVEELEIKRLKGDIDMLYAPMIKGVRALPSAQPQRMKGRWVRKESDLSWWYECSKCGESPLYLRTPFCPWCGAEIQEGGEDAKIS